jgi:hypothetical protein
MRPEKLVASAVRAVTISTATMARARNLTMAQQALGLRSVFPDADLKLKPDRLSWTGYLQPSALSRTYTAHVLYTLRRYPNVRILAPELQATETGFLPHTYDDGSLCLHDAGQWSASMLVVDTIISWTAEWLFHYELWLATSEWYGDHDPSAPPREHYDDLPAPKDQARPTRRAAVRPPRR